MWTQNTRTSSRRYHKSDEPNHNKPKKQCSHYSTWLVFFWKIGQRIEHFPKIIHLLFHGLGVAYFNRVATIQFFKEDIMASRIESYIHSDNSTPGKGGSLIEVRCKTDFGVKTDEFAEFAKFAAKIAYGFQVTTWEELIDLHPPVEDARLQLEEALGEPISVPQIAVMLPLLDRSVPDEKFPGLEDRFDQYHFFYGGYFSQWYHCDFEQAGIKYNCAEQFMMAEKARLFSDNESLKKIMNTRRPDLQKALGKTVKGFKKDVWESVCCDLVYAGNHAKFTQNPGLLYELMATKGKLLVEASPTDQIWGIGLAEDNPDRFNREKWRGTNWLGKVLTQLREDLAEGESSAPLVDLP